MKRRLSTLALSLTLLFGLCQPARADIGSLDRALSRWLQNISTTRFSATMELKALMPFSQDTLVLINNALKHLQINAQVSLAQDDEATDIRFLMADETLATLTEYTQGGLHTFTTSLLPKRMLTSMLGSPVDRLVNADAQANGEAAAKAANEAATQDAGGVDVQPTTNTVVQPADETVAPLTAQLTVEATATPTAEPFVKATINQTNVDGAFSMLDAVTELQACYQTLTDAIQPIATEKRANYNIKGIGAGKWSRIARLTQEQSDGLLSELRAVLSCGMDDTYRAEVAQYTFAKGFIVALYQNADQKDLCVYLKGTVNTPDGSQRKVLLQWAFVTNGLERTDNYKFEVSQRTGTTDSRVIEANSKQVSRSDAFSISSKAETTLKRGKITDKSTARIEISGVKEETAALTCVGSVSRELAHTEGGETEKTTESADVDVQITPDADGSVLSGTVDYVQKNAKLVQTDILFTFASDVASFDTNTVTDENGTANTLPAGGEQTIKVEATPTIAATTDEDGNLISSVDQINEDLTKASEPTEETQSAFLVGVLPIGLKTYAIPQEQTTVDVDTANTATLQSLMAELAQTLAGKLVLAVSALPGDDGKILNDGMTSQDYAAFVAMINAL